VLTEAEYKRLQDACRFHPRDQAIIEMFLQTGMRVSELTGLVLSDLSLPAKAGKDKEHAGSVRVRGKGRKERTITLNWKACQALNRYSHALSNPTTYTGRSGELYPGHSPWSVVEGERGRPEVAWSHPVGRGQARAPTGVV